MAEVAFVVPVLFGAGGMFTAANSGKEDNVFFLQSLDPFSDYYKFGREYNDSIDRLLMDPVCGCMGNKIVISADSCIPGEGIHEYFEKKESMMRGINKINFYKKIKTHNGSEIITYYCQVPPFAKLGQMDAFREAIAKLFISNDGGIRITSIDISGAEPRLYVKNQIYKTPTEIQESIGKAMIRHYFEPENNNNVKLLVTGSRGSQKTYMGKVIKKLLDDSDKKICATLVDNFNPKDIGVNIETMILNKATCNNPVIIVINEFDTIMDYVVDLSKQSFDPRLCHAKDKSTFNNMMDNIGDTRYCITIFTSETDVSELLQCHPDFKSFLRKGRIDHYVSMSLQGFEITKVA